MKAYKSTKQDVGKPALHALVVFLLSAGLMSISAAEVPQMVSYQGHLVNSVGDPIDSAVTITFSIYDLPEGGVVIWTETYASANVSDGWFNVTLGSINPLPDTVFADSERYLGVTLAGSTEMIPRTRLVSASYAHRVSSIDGAEGGLMTGIVEIGPAETEGDRLADPALIVRGNDADSVIISPVDDITIYSTNDAGDMTSLMTSSNKGGAMYVTATDVAKGTLRTMEISPGDSIVLRAIEATGENLILITADPGGAAMHVSATDVAKGLTRTVTISPRDSIVLSATESNGDQVFLITANPTGGAMYVTATDVAKGTQRAVEISPRDSVVLRATENNGDEVILITADPTGGAMYVSATDVAKDDPRAIQSTIAFNQDGVFIFDVAQSDTSAAFTTDGSILGDGRFVVGVNNVASGDSAAVSGGHDNTASGNGSAVLGGGDNLATGDYATIGGGRGNRAYGDSSFVGGGGSDDTLLANYALGPHCVVFGGKDNRAGANSGVAYSTVGGGLSNHALGKACVIAGGESNLIPDTCQYSAIGGGYHNTIEGDYCFIGGGNANGIYAYMGSILGGYQNSVYGYNGALGGGSENVVNGSYGFLGGGRSNECNGYAAVVGGGWGNRAHGRCSVVGGGGGYSQADSNSAAGDFSTVPGGTANQARGNYSFAAGRRAIVSSSHPGTFLWADSNDVDFNSAAAMEFAARSTGGVRFVTAIDGSGNPTAGVTLASGGGSWSSISDRNAKENFEEVNYQELLDRLAAIEMTTWNYKTQDKSIRHIGPMAQDFYEAFGVGEDDKHITTIDGMGVALAAIKGLCQENEEIRIKTSELSEMERRLARLRAVVQQQVTESQ
jgi:hypothetical protein